MVRGAGMWRLEILHAERRDVANLHEISGFDLQERTGESIQPRHICENGAEKQDFQRILSAIWTRNDREAERRRFELSGPLKGHHESWAENFRLMSGFDLAERTGESIHPENVCENWAEKAHFRPILSPIRILADCVAERRRFELSGPLKGHRKSWAENFQGMWRFDVQEGTGESVRPDNVCEKWAENTHF